MDRNTILKSIFCAAALALLASCTQDEPFSAAGDANSGEALPEGMYPLQIGSISVSAEGSGQPWTRVAETSDGSGSVFETGDMFYVKFEGSEQVGTYRIAEAGTVEAVDPVYWQSASEEQTIIAWYPAATKIDFTQQNKGLPYLLKATTYNASYNTATNLTFTHQLAKVRVVLTGTKASEVADVKIRSHPNAPISQGTLLNSNSPAAYYPMFKATYGSTTCWEANMIPGTLVADNSFHISKSDGTTVNVTLNNPVPIEAGKMHTITIEVNAKPLTITDGQGNPVSGYNLGSGTYIISGTGNQTITINGNANVTLDNANISVSSGNAISITGGSPTIKVVGENTLENNIGDVSSNYNYSGAGIYVASGSTVTITGNSQADVLTVSGGAGGCGIGGYLTNKTTPQNSGNIEIKNVTIKAYGSYDSAGSYSPAIGAAVTASVGSISISNAVVYAYGKGKISSGSAAIGGGIDYNGNVGQTAFNITISNSTIYATRGNSSASYIGAAGSQFGATAGYDIISTANITSSTIYNESGTEITK